MKILNLGLDTSLLDKNSRLASRVVEYGDLVDKYTVIVPNSDNQEIKLSDKVKVYGVGNNNKIIGLFKIFHLGKKLLQSEEYDLITVQDQYYLALVAWRLARKFKVGLEIQVHGFEKFFGLRKFIAKFVISRSDAIRTVSQRMKQRLIGDFRVAEEKITVVPVYTDIAYATGSYRSVEPDSTSLQDDKCVFLTIGRLVAVKNIGLQIEAIAEVVKKYKNVELWIVGDGGERKKLEVETHGNASVHGNASPHGNASVRFLGWQDDLEKVYSQADVFLLTSNYEGWGMVVIEAAGYGLPIIMTDVGCAGEVIKNGESGIVIPVGDQKALEEAMIKLFEDTELRKRLGEGARQAVEKLPSKEETLRLYKESWEKAIRISKL